MLNIPDFPDELGKRSNSALFTGILRGIEREALRVDHTGTLSQKPHPIGLGAAMTHPQITTDFSEALLEFITPPTHQMDALFAHLDEIHRFAISELGDELLWPNSMPCFLGDEDAIPVAQYGSSNNAKMKTAYRVGLGHRYGRNMQTVAGVHYNFSLPNAFWAHLQRKQNNMQSFEQFRNEGYFGLIRNFRRHFWLLILLFGASPAMCRSFVGGRKHALELDPHSGALHLPYATSLRMGDLGYQSTAQESLYVCYNEVDTYISTLCGAIRKPFPAYQSLGLRDENGEYKQLNTSLLQIENEFYSAVRPKRSAQPGETALTALAHRGVEYIEVRCLDLNPFSPLGFTSEQAHFVDTFLIYCALMPSPMSSVNEFKLMLKNQKSVVNEGRKPGLMLSHIEHGELSLDEWAFALLDAMEPVAKLLDGANENSAHSTSLQKARETIEDKSLCPSAQVLEGLKLTPSYSKLTMELAQSHKQGLKDRQLSERSQTRMQHMAEESLAKLKEMELGSTQSFDDFLNDYYAQYDQLCLPGNCCD